MMTDDETRLEQLEAIFAQVHQKGLDDDKRDEHAARRMLRYLVEATSELTGE